MRDLSAAPTPTDLATYVEAVGAGIEPELARKEVWGDSLPRTMYTVIDEAGGRVVGWDTCGSCIQHIRNCVCPSGPSRPNTIEKWATEATQEKRPTSVQPASAVIEGEIITDKSD